jgi:hypothetical protein
VFKREFAWRSSDSEPGFFWPGFYSFCLDLIRQPAWSGFIEKLIVKKLIAD